MKTTILLFATIVSLVQSALAEMPAVLPEPGPEDYGLRMRLVVLREVLEGDETFKVRVDVINTTPQPITLTADWPYDCEVGDFRAYLEACVSLETYPGVDGWLPQIMADDRQLPQPKVQLAGGGVLTVEWRAKDRKLKNTGLGYHVTPHSFPTDGLYSVHAIAALHTDNGTCQLRSNEQLVPIGGSHSRPKHSVAHVVNTDAKAKTVTLDLGSQQKIAVGDTFDIRVGMGEFWRMKVDRVSEWDCSGKITPVNARGGGEPNADFKLPYNGHMALLKGKRSIRD